MNSLIASKKQYTEALWAIKVVVALLKKANEKGSNTTVSRELHCSLSSI